MSTTPKGFWLLHLSLAALAAAAFLLLRAPHLGQAVLALVLAFNLGFAAWSWLAGEREWHRAWRFVLPISLLQILPDAVLVQALHVLRFPDLGAPRLAGVPIYMGLMWVIPLLWIVRCRSAWSAALLALLVFATAEWLAMPTGLWVADGVREFHGVALYVLVPEVLLGVMAWYGFRRHSNMPGRLWAAATISLSYTGALAWSWLITERLL